MLTILEGDEPKLGGRKEGRKVGRRIEALCCLVLRGGARAVGVQFGRLFEILLRCELSMAQ